MDPFVVIKRKEEVMEEETSIFVSILLGLNRPFRFSERKGDGTVDDPYYREVSFMASETDMKQIVDFRKRLRKIAYKNIRLPI